MTKDNIVIVAAKRTPLGAMQGTLSQLTAPELGRSANKAALKDANIDPSIIDEVILGCVLQAGIGQAPARQAAILAGIPSSSGATTINKMCGSGMKAIMFAHDAIKAENANIVMAGGIESMTNAPYLLKKARGGYRLGHDKIYDHMFIDGLEDAYDTGKLMGVFAEDTARHYKFTRLEQDEYATMSLQRALSAQKSGAFKSEVTPITIKSKKDTVEVFEDEGPNEAKLAKIPKLKPAFSAEGTVTAANSSSISDGAASLILMTETDAKKRGLKALVRIKAQAQFATEPKWFTTAPVGAIRKVLEAANWQLADVDLFEINEAFAVVAMVAIRELGLSLNKVNINGGACALGHPIGASGARIVVTLIHALLNNNLKKGVASLCIGGGEATALAIEVVE